MKGMTLLEILIASSLALIVGALLLVILTNHSGVFYKQNALVSEGVSLNDAMGQINDIIRQAAQVATGYPTTSPVYVSGSSALVVQMPAIDPSGDPLTNVYDYAVVAADSTYPNILRMQIFPNAQSTRPAINKVLTTLLQTVQFAYVDQNGNPIVPSGAVSVKTDLTLLSGTGKITSQRTATSITTLRNMTR
ncbi:MAG: hypothetical protein M1142_00820 [Patescibacteria group bacterium]|nr:hypothetical protein [Patescibacteria group bacterium]